MQRKRDERGFFGRLGVGAAMSVLAVLAVPAIAAAATVTPSGTSITFQASPGEANDLTVTNPSPDEYRFTEDSLPVLDGDGDLGLGFNPCQQTAFDEVTCSMPGLAAINVDLDDLGDEVDSSAVPVNTLVDAGDGVDTVATGAGNDILGGSVGIDDLNGNAGFDEFDGGAGADLMDGGPDTDTLTYGNRATSVSVDLDGVADDGNANDGNADAPTNIENLIGTDFDDTLTGDGDDNELRGGPGPDLLDGEGGFDTNIYGERATAVTADLDADSGDDGNSDDGTPGNRDSAEDFENLTGGDGGDTLTGDGSDNLIQVEPAAQTSSTAATEAICLTAAREPTRSTQARETTTLPGSSASRGTTRSAVAPATTQSRPETTTTPSMAAPATTRSTAGRADDQGTVGALTGLNGGADDDEVRGGGGSDQLIGGADRDRVSYIDSAGDVAVDLSAGTATGNGVDSLSGFEDISGSNVGLDELTGDSGPNDIDGLDGNNEFSGLGGSDGFTGGVDDDTVLYTNEGATTADLATTATNAGGTDTFVSSIENLVGSSGNDNFTGTGGVKRPDRKRRQ